MITLAVLATLALRGPAPRMPEASEGRTSAELRSPMSPPLDPAFCYTTQQWIQFPETSGYCPDGEAPFNGPGPSYGGGNHRWPDGSDD